MFLHCLQTLALLILRLSVRKYVNNTASDKRYSSTLTLNFVRSGVELK